MSNFVRSIELPIDFRFKITRHLLQCTLLQLSALTVLLFLTGCSSEVTSKAPPIIPPGKEIRFIAIGDTGAGNESQLQVAKAMKTKCENEGCDFVILLGDNIYDSGASSVNDPQFQTKFEIPYKEINIPFYAILGNHDYGVLGAGLDIPRSNVQIAYTDKSSKWYMPHHVYQFSQGDVDFIALDTNAQMYGVDSQQKKDVSQWISESLLQWKIALGHHPYLSNGPHGNAGDYDKGNILNDLLAGNNIKEFAESVWCGKVDIYISGHDHSRQWIESTCKGTQLIVSGAGSKTTELPGSNPVLFQAPTLGFLYARITTNQFEAEFINTMGDVEFSHTINK